MTNKKKIRNLGKEVRKTTGLPLPVTMRFAKLRFHNRSWFEIAEHPLLTPFVFTDEYPCGVECCGIRGYVLRGPKGSVEF